MYGEKVPTHPPMASVCPSKSDKHLFHIKYWLEVLLHKGKSRLFFKALEGKHKIKGARIGVS